jgi:hypothetical protein
MSYKVKYQRSKFCDPFNQGDPTTNSSLTIKRIDDSLSGYLRAITLGVFPLKERTPLKKIDPQVAITAVLGVIKRNKRVNTTNISLSTNLTTYQVSQVLDILEYYGCIGEVIPNQPRKIYKTELNLKEVLKS